MRSVLPIALVTSAILFVFMFSGFQCGSAEATSAKLYIKNQDWVNAEQALIKEAEKNPANAEAWYLLGDVRRQKSPPDYPGMVAAFDNSTKASNEFAEVIRQTKLSLWGSSLNAGVAKYNRSLAITGDSVPIYRNSAIESFSTALLVNPDSAMTYENMAYAQHADGNTDEEIRYLDEALKRKKSPQMSTALINAYVKKGTEAKAAGNQQAATEEFNKAIAALTEARAADPDNKELLSTLINLYIELGKAKEAVPLMREALEKDPSNKVFQMDFGLLLMEEKNFEEAIPHFEAALATDSLYEDALRNGAVAYMQKAEKMKESATAKGDARGATDKSYIEYFRKSARLLERLTLLRPDDAQIWDALATACGNANMIKEATRAIERADAIRKK